MATVVTVTGTFDNAPGVAASGEAVWQLSSPLFDSNGHLVATDQPIIAPITNGSMSVALWANDDSSTLPVGTSYKVTVLLDSTPPGGTVPVRSPVFSETYVISHQSAPTVDISTLTPAVSTSEMTSVVSQLTAGSGITVSGGDGAGHGSLTVSAQGTSGQTTVAGEIGDFAAAGSHMYYVDATSGPVNATLPVPTNGVQVTIKKIDATGNAVVTLPHGAESIDNGSSFSNVVRYQSHTFIADGSNWWVI